MGKKIKKSANNDVEAYRHEKETRKNVVPVGLASYDTSTKPTIHYDKIALGIAV